MSTPMVAQSVFKRINITAESRCNWTTDFLPDYFVSPRGIIYKLVHEYQQTAILLAHPVLNRMEDLHF